MLKNPTNIPTIYATLQFDYELVPCGSTSWSSPLFPFVIYASAFWGGEDGVAIEVSQNKRPFYSETIPWPNKTAKDHHTLEEFRSFMQDHIPTILHNITRKLYEVSTKPPQQAPPTSTPKDHPTTPINVDDYLNHPSAEAILTTIMEALNSIIGPDFQDCPPIEQLAESTTEHIIKIFLTKSTPAL